MTSQTYKSQLEWGTVASGSGQGSRLTDTFGPPSMPASPPPSRGDEDSPRCTQAPVGEDWRRGISKPTLPLRTPLMPMNIKSSALKCLLPQGHKEGFLGVLVLSLCLTWVLVTACLPHNNSLSCILFWMCVIIHDKKKSTPPTPASSL